MKLPVPLALLAALPASVIAQSAAPAQASPEAVEGARRVVATLTLAAQEYRLAFANGRLVNRAEWEEARLFVAEAGRSALAIPGPPGAELSGRIQHLQAGLEAGFPAESLASQARAIESHLSASMGVSLDERPSREPSYASGERLFASRCASCHGAGGRGDGPAGAGLEPAPADLADSLLLASTTPLDVFRKVTLGVPGTAMPGYGSSLSREERWDVVSYVLALTDPVARAGRSGPLAVVFGTVRANLSLALELAEQDEQDLAARRVLDAYMAFEAVEGALGATEPGLVSRAERQFASLRASLGARATSEADESHSALVGTLEEAELALTRGRSGAGLFAESLLLMLREGVEAILVIGAIMAVLIRAGARKRQRDVRWGVVAAAAASLATAALVEWVFRITPAQREALEGGVMLLAAAVLFYASYWLVSKVELAAWTRFVRHSVERAAETGSGLLLGGVAFLAVYREGFETVLFYKALFVTAGAGAAWPITGGIAAGLVILVALFVGIERFGLRIPMRPFFAVTGTTLAYMAFVFAGKAVKELQEGGYLSTTLLRGVPRNDYLGIYPTVESLGLQAAIVVAMISAALWTFVVRPRLFTPEADGPKGRSEAAGEPIPAARTAPLPTSLKRETVEA